MKRRLPLLAQMRNADCIGQCPLSGDRSVFRANSDIAVSFDYLAGAAKERNWECVARSPRAKRSSPIVGGHQFAAVIPRSASRRASSSRLS
jgi:hypothetical protein